MAKENVFWRLKEVFLYGDEHGKIPNTKEEIMTMVDCSPITVDRYWAELIQLREELYKERFVKGDELSLAVREEHFNTHKQAVIVIEEQLEEVSAELRCCSVGDSRHKKLLDTFFRLKEEYDKNTGVSAVIQAAQAIIYKQKVVEADRAMGLTDSQPVDAGEKADKAKKLTGKSSVFDVG